MVGGSSTVTCGTLCPARSAAANDLSKRLTLPVPVRGAWIRMSK
jgi:hypothetical protein